MKTEKSDNEDSVMRTDDERIEELHRRTEKLKKKRERRILAVSGSVSCLLAVLLIAVMLKTDRVYQSIAGSGFAGSSLLSDSAGGYVLAAVIAFFAGVILTALIYRSRKKR